jgi:hypothetical protein
MDDDEKMSEGVDDRHGATVKCVLHSEYCTILTSARLSTQQFGHGNSPPYSLLVSVGIKFPPPLNYCRVAAVCVFYDSIGSFMFTVTSHSEHTPPSNFRNSSTHLPTDHSIHPSINPSTHHSGVDDDDDDNKKTKTQYDTALCCGRQKH